MTWLPALMFMTLCAAVGFAVLQLFWFMHRRSNRQIAQPALTGTDSPSDPGALPELAGVGIVALIAMALLVVGYHQRDPEGTPSSQLPTEPAPVSATEKAPVSAATPMTSQARPRANPMEKAPTPTQYPLGDGSPNATPNSPPQGGAPK